ncbi:MAG: hypothetical protein KKA73_21165, partial [Chloroflexi bacterium]|nr:hypothetical protein [Chloroflexota bacterium]
MASRRGLPDAARTRLAVLDQLTGVTQPPERTVQTADLAQLRFVSQPREIIPPARLAALIAAGHNTPAAVLAVLQELAAQAPWTAILAELQAMAQTIRPPGRVRQPILCYREAGQDMVLDGHRRCLASLLAGQQTVPALALAGATAWERAIDRLVIVSAHADWTAIEYARGLVSAWELLQATFAGQTAAALPGLTVADLQNLAGAPAADEASGDDANASGELERLTGRWLKRATREVLQRLTGLGQTSFYHYTHLALRLAPAAQDLAQQARLTERQIRPVIALAGAPAVQTACLHAIAAHDLPGHLGHRLVQAVQAGAEPHAAVRQLL